MPTKKRNQILKGKHGGMQLVLTEDVQHLGKQGDLVEVKAGYGRNYLLPNGLATLPTQHNIKLLGLYKQRVQQAAQQPNLSAPTRSHLRTLQGKRACGHPAS